MARRWSSAALGAMAAVLGAGVRAGAADQARTALDRARPRVPAGRFQRRRAVALVALALVIAAVAITVDGARASAAVPVQSDAMASATRGPNDGFLPFRVWRFDKYVKGAQSRVDARGEKLGGALMRSRRYGTTPFDVGLFEPVDGLATAHVFGARDGTTYEVFAQAPSLDPEEALPTSGDAAILDHYQVYRKKRSDAKVSVTITEALLEAVDANGSRLTPAECPPAGQYCPLIFGDIVFGVRAYRINPEAESEPPARRSFFNANGKLSIEGSQGNWWWDTFADDAATVSLWDKDDFEEDLGADQFSDTVRLKRPRRLGIPLSRVPTGGLFVVHVRLLAGAINDRGRESSVHAYIQDPQRVGPTLIQTRGVVAQRTSPLPEPRPSRPDPARCGGENHPVHGRLEIAAPPRGQPSYAAWERPSRVARVLVTRSGSARGKASATLTTSDGSAAAGADYRRTQRTITFQPGDRTPRAVEIPIVHDTLAEPEETVKLRLSRPRCGVLGRRTDATLTIIDDDRPVQAPPNFTIGGTVTGLQGAGLVVSNQGEQVAIAADGPFRFPTAKADGLPYDVRVAAQPSTPDQVCTVANGAGTIASADVTNIAVNCTTPRAPSGLDSAFGGDGKVSTPGGEAEAVAIQRDGAIVTAGHNALDFVLMRHLANGEPDPSFGGGDGIVTTDFAGDVDQAFDVAIQPDGKIVAVGSAEGSDTGADFAAARYLPDGSLDPSFGGGDGKVTTDFGGYLDPNANPLPGVDVAEGVVVQPDGKIVLAGQAQIGLGPGLLFDNDFAAARYNPDGSPDTGFGGGDGKVTTDVDERDRDTDLGNAVALQPDGRIVVAGERRLGGEFALVRYQPNGDVDKIFGAGFLVLPAGPIKGVALRPDGRIVVGGHSFSQAPDANFAVARYDADGTADLGFGLVTTDVSGGRQFGHDFGEDLALQGDGKIVLVGRNTSDTTSDLAVVRYLEGGGVDASFGEQGILTVDFHGGGDFGQDIAIQPDGKIVAVGHTRNGFASEFALIRINP